MKNSELLEAGLVKRAAEATESLAKSMHKRVGSWHSEESEPKGLPDVHVSQDVTSVDHPTDHLYEKGRGWRTITGSGGGPKL